MLHQVRAICHKAGFSKGPCAWLAIDEVPMVSQLGLSLMWLLDEEEDALAERRFAPGEDGTSTLVPLLVCSDDMDFNCTVLMTEQVIDGGEVHWRRFGWSASGGLEVGVSTYWIADSKPVSFALSDFTNALSELKKIMRHCRGN
ncbi:hypothetical protein [Pseudomonas nitroreducens]|uniref:hypothetical protein n=1 Tax=Pseudomonas nitroreducens TaxID=46680 RepID=UPI003D2C568F